MDRIDPTTGCPVDVLRAVGGYARRCDAAYFRGRGCRSDIAAGRLVFSADPDGFDRAVADLIEDGRLDERYADWLVAR